MKKYTLIVLAGASLFLSSCAKDSPTVLPTPATPPANNFATISDGSSNPFDLNPSINFINLISTTVTSVLTINVNAGTNGTFTLALTVYGTDTTDKGTFTEYNSLKDGEAFSEFSNDGHGNITKISDYTVDSAEVKISNYVRGTILNANQVSGTFQLWLQPNRNSLATSYKTVSGTFNTIYGSTYYQ